MEVRRRGEVQKGLEFFKVSEMLENLMHRDDVVSRDRIKSLMRALNDARREVIDPCIYSSYQLVMQTGRELKGTKNDTVRTTRFYELTDLRKIKTNRSQVNNFDPFRIQEHWRTKIKLYNKCCICGETDNIVYARRQKGTSWPLIC